MSFENYQLPEDQLEEASHAVNTMLKVMGKTVMSASLADVLSEYEVKRCSRCKQLKRPSEFTKQARNRDGLRNECKDCCRKQGYVPPAPQGRLPEEVLPQAEATTTRIMHEFYNGRATPRFNDVLRAHSVKWCAGCQRLMYPESFPGNASTSDGLHSQCRDCNRSQNSRWYSENTEEIRVRYREWYKHNAESERERLAVWREQNPEYWESYYRSEDGRARLQKQLAEGQRRAEKLGNPAERVTPEDLLDHWQSIGVDPLICYLTGEELTPQTRSIDHVRAISKGGAHAIDNLMPCTAEANTKKKTKSPEEYLASITEEENQ